MYFPKRSALTALAVALMLQQGTGQAAEYKDVLETPAMQSELAIKSPLLDIVQAGGRMVSVGQRGHVLYSDDAGKTWHQASVPVSSDLTTLYFPTPTHGWAVGHDGVVLHSSDSGATWVKQLDGRQIGQIMLDYYNRQLAALPVEAEPAPAAEAVEVEQEYDEYGEPSAPLTERERVTRLVEDSQRMIDEGADKPFLDVWFENDKVGYVVGAFGMIMRTEDAGQNWTPVNHLVENPMGYHLTGIQGVGKDLYMVGEQGLVLKRAAGSEQFTALETPYSGSYFGLAAKPDRLVIYGLRGHAFRSEDGGKNWVQIKTGLKQAITASAVSEAGHVFLFSQAGHVLMSTDGGNNFRAKPQSRLSPVAGATVSGNQTLVLVGGRGVRVFPIE